MKNIVDCEIDFLGEDMKKISMKDSPEQEEKLREDPKGEVQEVQVEMQLTLSLLKNWKYTTTHPKDLILSDVSERITTRSKLHDIWGHYAFFSHIDPKNIFETEGDSCW